MQPAPHPYAHEVQPGTKWAGKPYNPMLAFHDPHGWVTRTVVVGDDPNPEGPDDPFSRAPDASWASILHACGFCSKSEARRLGFTGEAPKGFSERRVSANMVLYVWN